MENILIPHKSQTAELVVYENDIIFKKQGSSNAKLCERKRGKVNGLSKSAQKRMRLVARNIGYNMIAELGLTYPQNYPHDGRIVENHKRNFMKRLARMGISGMWVKEFQTKRGERGNGYAPHFHMMVTKWISPQKLSRMWYEVVSSGDIKHLKGGTHIQYIRNRERMGAYFAKYMTKTDQKEIPEDYINAGRMWGYNTKLLGKIIYTLNLDDKGAKLFLRYFKRWNNAQIRSWYHHRWKRKRPALGFTAWNGRSFFEAYRSRYQPSALLG
jgi:hypothetical protein